MTMASGEIDHFRMDSDSWPLLAIPMPKSILAKDEYGTVSQSRPLKANINAEGICFHIPILNGQRLIPSFFL